MSWRDAFTHLAAIEVTGVGSSYDLDQVPDLLPGADLPALVPQFPAVAGTLDAGERGLSALTYDGSAWTAALHVDHMLFWTPVWADAGLMAVLPDLIDAVDNYLAAVSADPTLGGALHAPLEIVRVQIGLFEYGGTGYYGARFRHRWARRVG